MSSLKDNFEELLTRIRHGRDLGPASFEPIYYLVFSPRLILEVKRTLPAWIARLRNENWDVHTFSIAERITSVLEKAPLRKLWLTLTVNRPSRGRRRTSRWRIGLPKVHFTTSWRLSSSRKRITATPLFWSQTWRRSILIYALGRLRRACTANSTFPRSFSIQGNGPAKHASSSWVFTLMTGPTGRTILEVDRNDDITCHTNKASV